MKNKFTIQQEFWRYYQDLVADVMLPYQYKVLNDSLDDPDIAKSHALENFRIAAGKSKDEFYGCPFQDSDTAKWLEAVAYSLMRKPDAELERQADEVIELVGQAQQADGYLDTFITVAHPDMRFKNLSDWHELYCAGHMIEAGVAYYEATGKKALLSIVCKLADLLCDTFGEGKQMGFPGHPEIELALVRLWNATGEQRYLDLAAYFINVRGTDPDFFKKEAENRGDEPHGWVCSDPEYAQYGKPVREQSEATGHAVRAAYLYTGMAMMAKAVGDDALAAACKRLWQNITQRRMYITGGIGSCQFGESFSLDFDLPNDIGYCETCASIALIFFAKAMLALDSNGMYADVMERALYNTVLGGLQRSGTRFLYTNPLAVDPAWAQKSANYRLIAPRRFRWHSCACCPPNAARLLASLDRYAWHTQGDTVYADLFIGGCYTAPNGTKIEVKTAYPYEDTVQFHVSGGSVALAVRIPAWSTNYSLTASGQPGAAAPENGYCLLHLKDSDDVTLTLDLHPRKVYADPRVVADAGCCALMAGPLVYCFEDTDNNGDITGLTVDADAEPAVQPYEAPELGSIRKITVQGHRTKVTDTLYTDKKPVRDPAVLTAIPFYLRDNRSNGKYRVWLPER